MSLGKAVSELVGAKSVPASGLRVDDDLLKLSQQVGKEVTDAEYIIEQATKLNNKASLFRDGSLRSPGQKGRIGFTKLRELKTAGDERALADAFRNVSDYQFTKDGSGLGGSPLVQEAFTKPGWKHSGRQSEIVTMSPHEYLKRSAEGHGLSVEELMAQLAQGDRTDEILNGMFEGKQFDMPYLDHRGGQFGQEGQHRAMAAAMLGMDEIPVGMMWDDFKANPKTRLTAKMERKAEAGFTDDVVYHSTLASRQFEEKEGFKGFSHFGTAKAAEDRAKHTMEEAEALLSRQSPNRGNRSKMTTEEFFEESFAQGEDFAPRTVPVNLKVHNPLEIRDNGLSDAHSHMQAAIQGMVDIVPEAKLEEYIRHFKAIGNNQEQQFAQIRRMLEAEGYDGLKYTNLAEDAGSESIVPLRPEQVRSPNAEFKDLKKGNIMAGGAAGAVGLAAGNEAEAAPLDAPRAEPLEDVSTQPQEVQEMALKAMPLLSQIGEVEANGRYDIVYGGETVDLENMTIQEVLDWQANKIAQGAPSVAVGKYQLINKTLKEITRRNPNDLPMDKKFDKETQDMVGIYLLYGRGLKKYLNGTMTKKKFALNLAKEWASFPVPEDMVKGNGVSLKKGQSYYANDGLNHSLVDADAIMDLVEKMKARVDAGQEGTPE